MRYVCPVCGDGGDAAGVCPADGVARAPVGADSLLGTTIGSWRVARMLGAGGMGRVYAAVQPAIGALVAIKVLKRESASDPDTVERFFNEARAVNMIKHEAIVDVIDLGRLPDGAPYIVMEYLDGASLGAIVRREKRLPLGTVAKIAGEVLAALEAAHAKAIIHRDLKPDNVFVSPSGRVTVLDFGVAKLSAGGEGLGATQTGSLLGTPAYMSPEQARSQPLDARADLYAIGVILYEAATGTLPFVAQNLFDLLQMHVAKPPRPPRELVPDMPEAFEAVIARSLAKDPADRFGSAAAMREALLAAGEGLPEMALSAVVADIEPPGNAKKSDPFAETAASDSIATDKTQASTPNAATPESADPKLPREANAPATRLAPSVQLSRTTLFALLGAAALLGLGGAALLMYLGRGNPQPVASPGRVAETREERDDANLAVSPADSSVVIAPVGERNVVPIDASVPIRLVRADARVATATSPIDAGVATASPSDANVPRFAFTRPVPHETVEQTLERLRVSPEQVFAANPKAVDPVEEYRSFAMRVMPLGGKTTRLNTFRIHHANAKGLVDVTANGSLEIFFSSPGLAKAGEDCYFLFIFEDGVGRFHRAEQGEKDDCTSGVMPPRCSLTEIIARATTKGMVIGKSGVTFNRFTRGWQVSSDDFSEFIDDDCE